MKSLYARLLLWSLATLFITGAGLVIVSMITAPPPQAFPGPGAGPWLGGPEAGGAWPRGGFPGPFGKGGLRRGGGGVRLVQHIRRIWEVEGPDALRAYVERLKEATGVEAVLADAAGKDVLTGESHSGAIWRLRLHAIAPPLFPLEHGGQSLIGVPSQDRAYWLLLYRAGVSRRFPLLPYQIWVFVSAAVISFFLARSIAAPVRQLRAAVDRFGHGDFAARANSKRSDEIGDLARAFDNMAARIETLVQAERRLLIDISHELRSPLTRLGLAVELARSGEDRDAALDRIQREADRLNSLVGGLLQVNRGEADPAALRRAPVALDGLLAEVIEDARFDAESRGCHIALDSPHPAVLDGDAELLRRALENVLRNAVRFAPPSTAIDVSLERLPDSAVIRVRDYGPGVPEHSLPHLFEAFYRVREGGGESQDGFGIGLSIARRAVALHRGTIRAVNAGPGLLVEIRLPLTAAAGAAL